MVLVLSKCCTFYGINPIAADRNGVPVLDGIGIHFRMSGTFRDRWPLGFRYLVPDNLSIAIVIEMEIHSGG